MRFLFKLIILIDVIVLLIGAYRIFDRFMRKRGRKKDTHFTFVPFENEGKLGYALITDDKTNVYYAVSEEQADDYSVYSFTNCLTNKKDKHRVSSLLKCRHAPNYSNRTFFFDNKEIWNYFEEKDLYFRSTILDENLTQYKIMRRQKTVAFIRKRRGSGNVYTMRTYEKSLDTLFLILFAFAKTREGIPNTKTEPSA